MRSIKRAQTFDMIFVNADRPPFGLSHDVLDTFVRFAPGVPLVLLSERSIRGLLTDVIRARMWVEIPKVNHHTDLLQRYTLARSAHPVLIVDSDLAVYERLRDSLNAMTNRSVAFPVVSSVGEAFDLVMNGRAPVFLRLARELPDSIDTTIVIYQLCPAIITILTQMAVLAQVEHASGGADSKRFGVLGPIINGFAIDSVLKKLGVSWSEVAPKPIPKPPIKHSTSLP